MMVLHIFLDTKNPKHSNIQMLFWVLLIHFKKETIYLFDFQAQVTRLNGKHHNPLTHLTTLLICFETGHYYRAQASLKVTNLPPLSPKCWDYRYVPQGPALTSSKKLIHITSLHSFRTGHTFSLLFGYLLYFFLLPTAVLTISLHERSLFSHCPWMN